MNVRLRLFAHAREAAGTAEADFDAATVDDLLAQATERFGAPFADVLGRSKVWVNGDVPAAGGATALQHGDEVAVLPPVSGGAGGPPSRDSPGFVEVDGGTAHPIGGN